MNHIFLFLVLNLVCIFMVNRCNCEINYPNFWTKSKKSRGSNSPWAGGKEKELCTCQEMRLCSAPMATVDIRIVTPPAGVECGPDSVYCCVSQPACGVRSFNFSSPPTNGQSRFGEYPWQALILNVENDYVGSGVILDSFHVLTAAHKVASYDRTELVVRVGDWDLDTENEPLSALDVRVVTLAVHPLYQLHSLEHDVAVLTVSQALPLYPASPHISSICLPTSSADFIGHRCWVSGWGYDKFGPAGSLQHVQKAVDVTVLSGEECEKLLRLTRLGRHFSLDHYNFLCAGGEKDKDACTGDGGSPLVCEGQDGRWRLVGLVAWGVGCGLHRVPGVYVNIANMLPWFSQFTQPGFLNHQ